MTEDRACRCRALQGRASGTLPQGATRGAEAGPGRGGAWRGRDWGGAGPGRGGAWPGRGWGGAGPGKSRAGGASQERVGPDTCGPEGAGRKG